MRLLTFDQHGELCMIERSGKEVPPYAILSHTWGPDHEEVSFKDFNDGAKKNTPGYHKIQFCVEQAKRDGLHHAWVDTCCIDKTNLPELSEAINSMFTLYENAVRCYVYLSDVWMSTQDGQFPHIEWHSAFHNSRWFTRGWTLQELLAPKIVVFFTRDHVQLGDKNSLVQDIHKITGIAIEALQGQSLGDFSIEERFKWAEKRETTKEEDTAYCLLGIFDISLSPIYGERHANAMRRLRREIMDKESEKAKSRPSGKAA
jgi:Heterokaryon incompatibility protein (HET)